MEKDEEPNQVSQYLGSFLLLKSISNNEIYFKTSIDPNRVSKLRNPKKTTMSSDEFYLIGLAIDENIDFDEMALYIYRDFVLNEKEKGINNPEEYHEYSKFGQFLSDGLIFQKTVSKVTNIKQSKLTALMKNKKQIPFAKDVFLAALATNRKPSAGFRAISGHLQLNSPERQEELRLEYEVKLAADKAKRDAEKGEDK